MRTSIIWSLVLFAFGCSSQQDPIGRDEVVKAVETLNEALVHPEKETLEKITSPYLTYGHSSGSLEDQEAFVKALIDGPFDFLSIDISEESIAITGDTAIARHIMSAKGANNGEPVDVHIGIMLVFQKVDGRLLLIGRQAYKL